MKNNGKNMCINNDGTLSVIDFDIASIVKDTSYMENYYIELKKKC